MIENTPIQTEKIKTINIGMEFSERLVNRNENQGDGKNTAIQFRSLFLSDLDNEQAWVDEKPYIILDFSHVKKIGPSFANEAFAYFAKYNATPEKITKKINFINISFVQKSIIDEELKAGYEQ